MPHPVSFVKAHPLATVVTFAAGMMAGPWLFNTLGTRTGVQVNLPTLGNGNGG